MVEAISVLIVTVICCGGWVYGRHRALSTPESHAEVRNRLAGQAKWMEERMHQAERESWTHDMRANLARQLLEVKREIERHSQPPKV